MIFEKSKLEFSCSNSDLIWQLPIFRKCLSIQIQATESNLLNSKTAEIKEITSSLVNFQTNDFELAFYPSSSSKNSSVDMVSILICIGRYL